MKLVIDESKWLRGEGHEHSRLLREKDGKMCCLGFLALACGFSEKEIKGRGGPDNIYRSQYSFVSIHWNWLLGANHCSTDGGRAMDINDHVLGSYYGESHESPQGEEDRKDMLKRIFAKNGIDLSFKGEKQ